jgi:HK97 family phage major capsid protein
MPTIKEAQDKVRELSQKGLDVFRDTTLTGAEQKSKIDGIDVDLKKWMKELDDLNSVEDVRKSFLAGAGTAVEDSGADHGQPAVRKSIGQQFVESSNYKSQQSRGFKGGSWTTGEVEVKTLLAEGTSGTPGVGFAPVATPSVLPGIVSLKFQPLTVADLFPSGTTNTALIRYLVESAVTNAAAATAEGALKPESALTFANVDLPLTKIATFLPVTDEMLEDFAQIQSYIDARLSLFVQIAEEAQLLSGNGTAPQMTGLLNRSGLATSIAKGTSPSVAGDNDMDAILRQITAIRTTAWLEPDAIVMHPTVWQTIQLSKATGTGNYLASGPFVDTANQTLWGKKVVLTTASGITSTTALVGAFAQGGQIFRKGGLTVEASNSHADFFQRNQVAIRAEERVALAVYRPGAFGTVTNL